MAPMALMNMVSSNINQWTMLVAMLPIAFALALGHWRTIEFNGHQRLEILLTISQSLLGALLLANMKFSRWEAATLFTLWAIQFVLSGFEKPLGGDLAHSNLAVHLARAIAVAPDALELLATRGKEVITGLYFAWSALVVAAAVKNRSLFAALVVFPRLVREHW
jgi:hypothetical protein